MEPSAGRFRRSGATASPSSCRIPRCRDFYTLLVLLLAIAPACAAKPSPATTTPEPAAPATASPPSEPVAAEAPPPEPAPPDNSALIAALDALDAAIAGCQGKLGTKQADTCAEPIAIAVGNLAEPIQGSRMAADLAAGRDELQSHADELTKAVKAGKARDKDQHHHLDEITRIATEMRGNL